MNEDCQRDLTTLLRQIEDGDNWAKQEFIRIVYPEIRQIARSRLKHERSNHTLQTTDLAHEVCLRLLRRPDRAWENRTHFLRHVTRAIRNILVDHARKKKSVKHGGAADHEPLDHLVAAFERDHFELVALNETLEKLEAHDPDLNQLIQLRLFGGLSTEESALALERPLRSTQRDWKFASAWLRRQLAEPATHEG